MPNNNREFIGLVVQYPPEDFCTYPAAQNHHSLQQSHNQLRKVDALLLFGACVRCEKGYIRK